MKKKVSTWHKNKTAPKYEIDEKKHWIESHARLMKILEASGIKSEKTNTMLTCDRDR